MIHVSCDLSVQCSSVPGVLPSKFTTSEKTHKAASDMKTSRKGFFFSTKLKQSPLIQNKQINNNIQKMIKQP